MIHSIRFLKWIGLSIVVFLVVYWVATTLATVLLRHSAKTLSVLAGIESIRHWFFLMRFTLYAGFYCSWAWILRQCQSDMPEETIVETRKIVVRFFILYEFFFGSNVIAFLLR